MKYSILTFSLVAIISLFSTIVKAQEPEISCSLNSQNSITNKQLKNQKSYTVKNTSGQAEIGLARHLKKIKAKMYGAYWCPYCHKQQEMFGKQAWAIINYIECDPQGKNSRRDLCEKAKVEGYPTWEVKGQTYPGKMSLEDLAKISGYTGKRNFKN